MVNSARANPELRVVGAHLGSMADYLEDLAAHLDTYPNFVMDTAGRLRSLTFQPRDKVRAFILKYQDRVLHGTDLHFFQEQRTLRRRSRGKTNMPWIGAISPLTRLFEYLGNKVEGLNLPRPVLKKLYHDNAVRWIPGVDASPRSETGIIPDADLLRRSLPCRVI
jgi:hypothetical protein